MIFLFYNLPILPIIIFLLLPILFSHLFKPQIIKHFHRLFLLLSLSLIGIEVIRIFFLVTTLQFRIQSDLSIQLCFLYPIICLLAIITKQRYFYDYIACSSLLFGIGAIILFSYQDSFFQFHVIINYIYHSIIILIGLMFYKNYYEMHFSSLFPILIIFFTQLCIAYLINHILGPPTNYMFLSTIFEPGNQLYHTQTLHNFYTPILFSNSISHYLNQLKSFLGNGLYILFVICLMIMNYILLLNSFINKNDTKS